MSTEESISPHLQKEPADSDSSSLFQQIQQEAQELGSLSWDVFWSFAWLWPIRGLLFSITHPGIILSVRYALLKSLIASVVIFALLAFFTFLPQLTFLAFFTGPLAPLIALLLVCAESVLLIATFARALFLDPALTRVFDATLLACGQTQLVLQGRRRLQSSSFSARKVGDALVRPLQAFSREGMLRYVLSLPLNFIPAVGTVLFLLYNGHKSGPGWHAHYFQLKGMSGAQSREFVDKRRAEYTAFGMTTLLFNFIPLVGLVFSFTNTVGAALWAAQLEAEANIIESGEQAQGRKKLE